MKQRLIGLAFLTTVFIAGCGYVSSGKWEDDPENWKRAWGNSKPAEVAMPHSWYWRSPHWTREEAYFFEFEWNEQLFNQLVASNALVMRDNLSGKVTTHYCFGTPPWFLPKSESAYEIWHSPASDEIWLFRDAENKELFLYACQV